VQTHVPLRRLRLSLSLSGTQTRRVAGAYREGELDGFLVQAHGTVDENARLRLAVLRAQPQRVLQVKEAALGVRTRTYTDRDAKVRPRSAATHGWS
jgi:hypothetical protein